MRRTTILLPDELATLVEIERKRRDVTTAELVRLALTSFLQPSAEHARRFSFIGIAESGVADTSERVDELLAEGFGSDRGSR
jgi:hypothetical protein